MDTDVDLWDAIGLLFEDIFHYRRLVSKFIYLTITRLDIAYVVGLVSQLHKPKEIHWKAALRIMTYIKGFSCKALLYKKHEQLRIKAF